MKKILTILFVFFYITATAQNDIFIEETIGLKKPLIWDSINKIFYILNATPKQDGIMSSALVRKLDSLTLSLQKSIEKTDSITIIETGNFIHLENLIKSQAGLILALKNQVEAYEYRIGQLEINLRLTGSQVDINRLKIEGMNNILTKAMYDLINIK